MKKEGEDQCRDLDEANYTDLVGGQSIGTES